MTDDYVDEFKIIFKKDLSYFYTKLFRFDLNAFHIFLEKLGKPHNKSTHDYVYKNYGQDALDLMIKLIKIGELRWPR